MGKPAAKKGDKVITKDVHLVQPPGPVKPIETPFPFNGVLTGKLSSNVTINGFPAATVDSMLTNTIPHTGFLLSSMPGSSFVNLPKDQGTVIRGSASVFINGRAAARADDIVETCADPMPNQTGKLIAVSTVMIGD